MKLAFCINDLKLRADIRHVLRALNDSVDLTLFIYERELPYVPEGINVKLIDDYEANTGKWGARLFKIFGKLPNDNWYYKSYIKRKLTKRVEASRLTKLKTSLLLSMPKPLTYRRYIDAIGEANKDFNAYDAFVGVTNVVSDKLYADFIASQVPTFIYVVSWDHAAKFNKFLPAPVRYLVWNEGMADDLRHFHGTTTHQMTSIKCSQFSYIKEYFKNRVTRKTSSSKYVYAIAAFGYSQLAVQEVEILIYIAKKLQQYHPSYTLLFRPYPMLADSKIYEPLLLESNVQLDKLPVLDSGAIQDEQEIYRKYQLIDDAVAVFHAGSTMGLEAAYFDTPVLTIAGDQFDDVAVDIYSQMSYSQEQWHLKKYFDLGDYANIFRSYGEIDAAIQNIDNPNLYLEYNSKLSNFVEPVSIDSFVSGLLECIRTQGEVN